MYVRNATFFICSVDGMLTPNHSTERWCRRSSGLGLLAAEVAIGPFLISMTTSKFAYASTARQRMLVRIWCECCCLRARKG